MTTPISFRPNEEDTKNLAVLEAAGMSTTTAIRTALADAARRRRLSNAVAAEVERLRRDPADLAEIKAIREFMGDRFVELPE